jgi:hypothetical protein
MAQRPPGRETRLSPSGLQKSEPKSLKRLRRAQNARRQAADDRPEGGARRKRPEGYSCGSATGWAGTAEASGPGPAPSR